MAKRKLKNYKKKLHKRREQELKKLISQQKRPPRTKPKKEDRSTGVRVRPSSIEIPAAERPRPQSIVLGYAEDHDRAQYIGKFAPKPPTPWDRRKKEQTDPEKADDNVKAEAGTKVDANVQAQADTQTQAVAQAQGDAQSTAQVEAQPDQQPDCDEFADAGREVCEAAIGESLMSFVRAGGALRRVRTRMLFEDESPTFQQYCLEKWRISKSHAHRLMDGAAIYKCIRDAMGPGCVPVNEYQVRPLERIRNESGDLDRERIVDIWQCALTKSRDGNGGYLTSSAVQEAVNESLGIERRQQVARIVIRPGVDSLATITEAFERHFSKPLMAGLGFNLLSRAGYTVTEIERLVPDFRVIDLARGKTPSTRQADATGAVESRQYQPEHRQDSNTGNYVPARKEAPPKRDRL